MSKKQKNLPLGKRGKNANRTKGGAFSPLNMMGGLDTAPRYWIRTNYVSKKFNAPEDVKITSIPLGVSNELDFFYDTQIKRRIN